MKIKEINIEGENIIIDFTGAPFGNIMCFSCIS